MPKGSKLNLFPKMWLLLVVLQGAIAVTTSCKVLANTDQAGGFKLLKTAAATTDAACNAACVATPGCVYWRNQPTTTTCWLSSTMYTATKTKAGWNVGLRCKTATPCQTLIGKPCIFPFKYKDKTYTTCTTVDNSGRTWCPVSASNGYFDGNWSECKEPCTAVAGGSTCKVLANTDQAGGFKLLKTAAATTDAACNKACLATSGCVFWINQPTTTGCWLSSTMYTATKTMAGRNIGLPCTPTTTVPTSCKVLANTDQAGGYKLLKTAAATTDTACNAACVATAGCVYWINQPTTTGCWLSSTMYTATKTMANRNIGLRCGPKPVPTSCKVLANTDQAGGLKLLKTAAATTDAACNAACLATAGCVFWINQPTTTSCWLSSTMYTGTKAMAGRNIGLPCRPGTGVIPTTKKGGATVKPPNAKVACPPTIDAAFFAANNVNQVANVSVCAQTTSQTPCPTLTCIAGKTGYPSLQCVPDFFSSKEYNAIWQIYGCSDEDKLSGLADGDAEAKKKKAKEATWISLLSVMLCCCCIALVGFQFSGQIQERLGNKGKKGSSGTQKTARKGHRKLQDTARKPSALRKPSGKVKRPESKYGGGSGEVRAAWKAKVDKTSGRTYYYHKQTKESKWVWEPESGPPPEPRRAVPAVPMGTDSTDTTDTRRGAQGPPVRGSAGPPV